eukprot:3160972-Alexandrium_andersonii.AAC.1
MSASLVGSEMCIRDSPRRRQGSGAETEPEPRPLPASPGVLASQRRGDACLLYTSDAADDM